MAYFKCPRCGTEHRLTLVQHPVDFIQESDLLVMILDGDAIEKVKSNDPKIEGAIYALKKRSDLPDLQFKILRELSFLGTQRRMTAMELKSELGGGHLRNIRVKEIREALKEMEKAGLVKSYGRDQWEKVDA